MIAKALWRALPQIFHPAARAVLFKSMALTLIVFAGAGVLAWLGLRAFFIWIGWEGTGSSLAQAAGAAAMAILIGWLLFRTVATIMVGLFSDAVVVAVERESYPGAARTARPVTFAAGAGLALRSVGRNLGWNFLALPFYIALLVTGVGTMLLFLAVNAYVAGRDLADMVESRHPDLHAIPPRARWLMGLVSALLFLVPVVNLLAPIWSAAMAVHILHGRDRPRPEGEGASG
ncbi:EI24 domain-containing protein [Sphingobium sp. H39-3-25]|uniref:EI24 domain-containing protein n=1 Tax=Sphingobium arseniciresistens TaxID=3030834 RepID=UPI0023B97A2D|nr:EI24 domain-containing protein [Sphingobium arseniciresistens]